MPPKEEAGLSAGPVAALPGDDTPPPGARATLPGYRVRCPFCWRLLLPDGGLLHLALAPRLAFHLWEEHAYEAAILRMHLGQPPSEWPVVS